MQVNSLTEYKFLVIILWNTYEVSMKDLNKKTFIKKQLCYLH